jgi:hypothetical protein
VVDPIPSSVNPALPSESETKVVDPTLSLESVTQVVNLFPPIDPIPPLENETHEVDLSLSLVDPTILLESKHDIAHIFLVDIDPVVLGGIPPSPVKPLPSNEAILFNWGVLTGPCLPSHIPF